MELDHTGRTQELLKKWLEGDVTSEEEVELFAIAEGDPMLKDALEGYISEQVYGGAKLPVVVGRVVGAEPIISHAAYRSRRWMVYIAATVVILLAVASIVTLTQFQGDKAEVISIDLTLPELPEQDVAEAGAVEEAVIAVTEQRKMEQLAPATVQERERPASEMLAELSEEVPVTNEEEIANPVVSPGFDLRTEPEVEALHQSHAQNQQVDQNELPAEAVAVEPEMEDQAVADAIEVKSGQEKTDTEDGPKEGEVALQFFDYDADAVLKHEVKQESIKDGDQPITGYEIDIKAGVSPEDLAQQANGNGAKQDSSGLDIVGLQSKTNMTNASARPSGQVQTNMIANNVVISEYKIQKKDIIHPPVEDYNSLVREKYKRKANPEVGFYQYKKFLKRATSCLIDEYRNADYLEEAIIRFRVFRDGSIDFIELFGTSASPCVENVSAEITTGPKWEVADHYESIDVEIPFKVLYPYLY